VSYSWVRRRQRKRVPFENPEGRRVNALAALVKGGGRPALYWVAKPGSLRARHLVAFLTELPAAPVPTVIVLDNGSIHRSKETRAAIPALWARGVFLYFLPPYSPELNAIEPVFGAIKHRSLPERRYTTVPALIDAVHAAFTAYEEALIAQSVHHPRRAA
jgi:putative transposase